MTRKKAVTTLVKGERSTGKFRQYKTEVNGIVFDSQTEATRYQELCLLAYAGEIRNLVVQPTFLLQAGFRDQWKRWNREISYTADFQYDDVARKLTVVEDVKAEKVTRGGKKLHPTDTEAFRLRARLFQKLYPDYYLHIEYRRS